MTSSLIKHFVYITKNHTKWAVHQSLLDEQIAALMAAPSNDRCM
ncbi:hypothetical protein [Paenibacillus illinoisensis]